MKQAICMHFRPYFSISYKWPWKWILLQSGNLECVSRGLHAFELCIAHPFLSPTGVAWFLLLTCLQKGHKWILHLQYRSPFAFDSSVVDLHFDSDLMLYSQLEYEKCVMIGIEGHLLPTMEKYKKARIIPTIRPLSSPLSWSHCWRLISAFDRPAEGTYAVPSAALGVHSGFRSLLCCWPKACLLSNASFSATMSRDVFENLLWIS